MDARRLLPVVGCRWAWRVIALLLVVLVSVLYRDAQVVVVEKIEMIDQDLAAVVIVDCLGAIGCLIEYLNSSLGFN